MRKVLSKLQLIYQIRTDTRSRRYLLAAGASIIAKLSAVLTSLIVVPLALNYLGKERYGLWATISSMVIIASLAEFGVGNSLLSAVASCQKNERLKLRGFIANGSASVFLISVVVLSVFLVGYPFIKWDSVFNVKSALARDEVGISFAIFLIGTVLSPLLNLVQKIQLGLQQGFMAGLWQFISNMTSLALVYGAIKLELGLPYLVAALVGAPVVIGLLNNFLFFCILNKDLIPAFDLIAWERIRKFCATGSLFFLMQILGGLAYATDNIVISQTLGADSVAGYSVPERLFGIVSAFITIALTPLWPAYSNAIALRDIEWILAAFKRSIIIAASMAACTSLILVVLGPTLISFWVGPTINPSIGLLLGFAVWKVIESVSNSAAIFLNGTNDIGVQVIIAAATILFSLALKVSLAPNWGVTAIIWSQVFSYILIAAVPSFIVLRKAFRKLS